MKHVPVLVALLLLAGGGQGSAETPLLAPAGISPFNVGSASGQVLLADINNDRHLDLLTRHQQARRISMHLGDSRAQFTTTRAAVALTFSPGDMSLGDVKGDRFLDLVVTATDRDVGCSVTPGPSSGMSRAHPSPPAHRSQPTVADSTRFESCWEMATDDLQPGRS
jgi:hypothetical protein